MLIVQYFHEQPCRSDREQTFTEINERFWIVRGRSLVKNFFSNCFCCKRLQKKPPVPPVMKELPVDRFDIGKPTILQYKSKTILVQ